MLVSQRRTWLERRRGWVFLAMVLAAIGGFGFGPILGLLILPLILGIFFAYGLALSRPLGIETPREIRGVRAVYGLLFAFVPGLLLVFVASSYGSDAWQRQGWRSFPIEVVALWCFQFVSVTGMALSAHKIVKRRGSRAEGTVVRYALWVFAVSAVAFATFFVLDFLFWTPLSSIEYLRVGLWLSIPGGVAFLVMAGLATRRMANPVPEVRAITDAPPPAPLFRPFRG